MGSQHLTLASTPPDLITPAARPLHVTRHAVDRYRQRVEPSASYMTARLRLEQMVALGRTRSTPRHWMRGRISPTPGLRFLYWSQRPSICALVVGNAIVTVVTRSMFRAPTLHEVRREGRP